VNWVTNVVHIAIVGQFSKDFFLSFNTESPIKTSASKRQHITTNASGEIPEQHEEASGEAGPSKKRCISTNSGEMPEKPAAESTEFDELGEADFMPQSGMYSYHFFIQLTSILCCYETLKCIFTQFWESQNCDETFRNIRYIVTEDKSSLISAIVSLIKQIIKFQ
jgi:hypothetical protein